MEETKPKAPPTLRVGAVAFVSPAELQSAKGEASALAWLQRKAVDTLATRLGREVMKTIPVQQHTSPHGVTEFRVEFDMVINGEEF